MGAVEVGCATARALAECSTLDSRRVVAWAEWMAENQPAATKPTVSEGAAVTLRTFANILGDRACRSLILAGFLALFTAYWRKRPVV
jgi:hypothetical protein